MLATALTIDPVDRYRVIDMSRFLLATASPPAGRGGRPDDDRRPLDAKLLGYGPRGGVAEWLRQGPAKPSTRVRLPAPPPRVHAPAIRGSIPTSPHRRNRWRY